MKTFKLKFSARKIGAIGIYSDYTKRVKAQTEEEAKLLLYNEFYNISFIQTAKHRNIYFKK